MVRVRKTLNPFIGEDKEAKTKTVKWIILKKKCLEIYFTQKLLYNNKKSKNNLVKEIFRIGKIL